MTVLYYMGLSFTRMEQEINAPGSFEVISCCAVPCMARTWGWMSELRAGHLPAGKQEPQSYKCKELNSTNSLNELERGP